MEPQPNVRRIGKLFEVLRFGKTAHQLANPSYNISADLRGPD